MGRQNREAQRVEELEVEVKNLHKQIMEKDEVIEVLKNLWAYFQNCR